MSDKTTEQEKQQKEEKKDQEKPARSEKVDEPKEKKEQNSDKPEQQEKPGEQEKGPPLLDEPIKVLDYIYLNMLTLEGKAWAYMDLIAHPETQKHLKDMDQAKIAIDTIDILYKTVEEHLTDDQKKDLKTRLTNLRLNFVKK